MQKNTLIIKSIVIILFNGHVLPNGNNVVAKIIIGWKGLAFSGVQLATLRLTAFI